MDQQNPETVKMTLDAKTERLVVPPEDSTRTERLSVPENPADSIFTGSLEGGETIRGYKVETLISARTGEAEIFLAEKDGKKAVIKYYHGIFKPVEKILQKLHHLDHPDIIDLYEYGSHYGRFFEIMEFAAGGTLGDKNPDGSPKYLPMEESKVIGILKEVLASLQYIHEQGIIHRDIKPGNLFYRNENGSDVMIGDFGISSQLDVADGKSKRITAKIALSEGYAAPELYGIASDEGQAKILIGPEVDYYALGMTIFEMLTGISPFKGKNPLHIMRDTIEGRVADTLLSLPESGGLTPRMKSLLRGLLTVRHDKRWGHEQIESWLVGEKVEIYNEAPEIPQTPIPPLRFGEETIISLTQLVRAMDENRELASKYLMRGMLEQWAMKFDESLASTIMDARELRVVEKQKISFLLFKLDFSRSCNVEEKTVSSLNDFLELLRTKPALMGHFIVREVGTDCYPWLYARHPEKVEIFIKTARRIRGFGLIPSINKVILETIKLYVSLAGEQIKPFADNQFVIPTVDDLISMPAYLRDRAVQELKTRDSILYLWILSKNIPNFEFAWNSIEHSWDNLVLILTGAIRHYNGEWMSEKQADEKEAQRLQKKRLAKELQSAAEQAQRLQKERLVKETQSATEQEQHLQKEKLLKEKKIRVDSAKKSFRVMGYILLGFTGSLFLIHLVPSVYANDSNHMQFQFLLRDLAYSVLSFLDFRGRFLTFSRFSSIIPGHDFVFFKLVNIFMFLLFSSIIIDVFILSGIFAFYLFLNSIVYFFYAFEYRDAMKRLKE